MTVYLDHNATTPLDERVLEAMLPYLRERYGNPSSTHRYGRAARAALDQAREQAAALVGAAPSQIIFTSGGTEANNLALKGVAGRLQPGRMAVSAIEHASVLEPAHALAKQGWALDLIPVDQDGRMSLQGLEAALTPQTVLVSVMMANNETGVIQDISGLSVRVRAAGAWLHTDAVQAAGKIPVDFAATGAHLMSLSAHKIYGPKGVGALVVDKTVELEPLLHGGGQEREMRGGTENLAGIVGFGAAAELARQALEERAQHVLRLRQLLEAGLALMPGVKILAHQAQRLPNTAMAVVPGIESETLLMILDQAGIAVSAGSACSASHPEPSHVLTAMGLRPEDVRSAVRISLGKDNTGADIAAFLEVLDRQIKQLQSMPVTAWTS